MPDASPHRLVALVDRVSGAVGSAVSWALVGMTLAGAAAAILRYLARPLGLAPALNALGDVQWMLFAAVVILGASWALRDDGHVRVDVAAQRFSPRTRAWIDLTGHLLLLLPFCGFLLWALWPAVAQSVALREAALDPGGLARWPIKVLVLGAVGLLAMQGLAQAARAVLVLRSPRLGDAVDPTTEADVPEADLPVAP
ncbi:MAG: TRAP transporter small permease subunit [Bacteroidota bacterium]